MQKVAFLGLGAMGSRMAKRLIERGYFLNVYNRSPQKAEAFRNFGKNIDANTDVSTGVGMSIKIADSPIEAVKDADVVISMLTDDEASRRVWLAEKTSAIKGLKQRALVIESSTLSPSWVNELSAAIKNQGANFLEGPVAGSLPQAESGKLIYFIGGGLADLSEVETLLSVLAEKIHFAGAIGSAAVLKLIVNAYFLSQIATLSELFTVAKQWGLDMKNTNELFQALPATSIALKGILQLVAQNNHEPRFPIALVEKDMRYLLDSALKKSLAVPLNEATYRYFLKALNEGHGNKNASAIVEM